MSRISHVWKEGSIESTLKASILLRCCAKVMFSRFVTKCCEIFSCMFFTLRVFFCSRRDGLDSPKVLL